MVPRDVVDGHALGRGGCEDGLLTRLGLDKVSDVYAAQDLVFGSGEFESYVEVIGRVLHRA